MVSPETYELCWILVDDPDSSFWAWITYSCDGGQDESTFDLDGRLYCITKLLAHWSSMHNLFMYPGSEFSCPTDRVNARPKNEEKTKGVTSWEACSELCRQREDCTHWTWHPEHAGQWAHDCVVGAGYKYTNCDDNTVSGTRDCGAK